MILLKEAHQTRREEPYGESRFESWDFHGCPVVKILPSSVRGSGSIPAWGTKIPHATGCGQKLKKKKDLRANWRDFDSKFLELTVKVYNLLMELSC